MTDQTTPAPTPTADAPQPCDLLVVGGHVVTMGPERTVFTRGAVAVRDDVIVDVGPADEVEPRWRPARRIDGRRFVVTPGLVNTHIHITGEPLARGFVPDDTPFEENVFVWLCPLYATHTAADEALSARLATVEMLRSGTTAFLEAGTIRFLDEVVESLAETGIRGRVGQWIWDRPPEPEVYRQTTDEAIANLQRSIEGHRHMADGRIDTWSILVGHTTCSDELWRAARQLADDHDTGLSFHMSPAAMDHEGFLAEHGRRPFDHLERIGVLGDDALATHVVHVDDDDIRVLARTGTSVSHCPTTALKVSYGVTQIGRFPEMLAAGVNVGLGTDGCNAANSMDLMRATYLAAGLFKDARRDPTMIPATQAFEMATLHGARALNAEDQIGSLEVGKQADLVLHDTDRPEWRPLHDVANQLVWSADGRGVHTVVVAGRIVVEDYTCTTVDEAKLWADAQQAGQALVARSGLPDRRRWPHV